MSNPVTPAAISVGGGGSPDQVLRHTPDTSAARDNAALPEILHPIYDSTEQERRVNAEFRIVVLTSALKTAREALKVSLRWLNHHEDGYDWCPRCIVEEALARIDEEAPLANPKPNPEELARPIGEAMERVKNPETPCGRCGHPKWMHDGLVDVRERWCRGGCMCLEFEWPSQTKPTESPVTDGEHAQTNRCNDSRR